MSDEFLWGAATSAHQIEGDCTHNDWWAWEEEGRIEGGTKSGKATDHWNRRQDDLRLARDLGLNSYRFSVEWSKIEPEEGKWNDSALDWYESLIIDCEKFGLKPMLTLHHFTSPLWFTKRGGFTLSTSPEYFKGFVKRVVKRLGGRVPLWCTFNEPMVLVAGGYLASFMPPACFAPKLAALACRNLLRAHVYAYDAIHAGAQNRQGPWKDSPLRVGIAHNMLDFQPDRKWHLLERILVYYLDRFYNRAWLDAILGKRQNFSVPFLIQSPDQVPEAFGRKTCDFIGVNYYTRAYVQWRPRSASPERPKELPIGLSFARRKELTTDMGWSISPEGFDRVLSSLKDLELPIYITENGIADREDRLRSSYLSSHLRVIAQKIRQGLPIEGYYHWSLLDNFEWMKGFGPRFGLYRVDYSNFDRIKTDSASFFEKIIAAHGEVPGRIPSMEFFGRF